jgi:hypothetical protein
MHRCPYCPDDYPTHAELERHREKVGEHLRERLAASEAEVLRVRELINRDRTGLAEAIDKMVKEARSRLWVVDGRGSYSWDDDRYRREAGLALRAIIELGKKALRESGNRAGSAFHPDRSATS